MADLIDRDVTIKLFCDDCCKRRGVTEMCGDNDKCQDISVLKSVSAVNRWIPCSERLPEKAGEYLVTYHPCYWDYVEWSKRCVGIDTFRGKTTWAKKKYQRVIAWMPMPDAYEPPKEV